MTTTSECRDESEAELCILVGHRQMRLREGHVRKSQWMSNVGYYINGAQGEGDA
jgi:hypothetical protein